MNDDTISRRVAIDALFELYEYQRDIDPTEAADLVRQGIYLAEKKIEQLPSAQPERKKGKWKAKSFHECFCDNCGFSFDIMNCDFLENMKYCPNCGAKMEGAK